MERLKTKLEKNRSGYYEIRWTEGRRSKSVSCRTTSRAEAEAFRKAWLAAELNGGALTTGLAVRELLDTYERQKPGQKWNLVAIRGWFGDMAPEDIVLELVEDYTAARLAAGKSSGTVRRELGALTAALNFAVKTRKLAKDKVPYVPLPPDGQARQNFLLEDDEARLWALALAHQGRDGRHSRVGRFVCLALATAARKEAIETLRWDQVDLAAGLIDFKDVGRAATKKRRSRIPIAPRLACVLDAARREATGPYVLDNPGSIRTAWENFVAGTPWGEWLTIHDLRRTWATLAARRGVSMWDIANVLGDTLETTTKHYAVFSPDNLKGVMV